MNRQHGKYWLPWFSYAVFVIYGSLVPFDFHPRSFPEAITYFQNIRYLSLDVVSRADWIANILLYIPLSYLLCGLLLQGRKTTVIKIYITVIVLLVCILLAAGIEFTQQFFKPRTVSLNDLIAESMGTVGGILIWLFWGHKLRHYWQAINGSGVVAFRSAIVLYALLYLALSLFPFDFLISGSELRWKLEGDGYGLILAGGLCNSTLRCTAKLLSEVVGVIPFGIYIGMALANFRGYGLRTALVAGLILGMCLEVVQFFLASGVSQGLSVVTRMAGMGVGVFVYEWFQQGRFKAIIPYTRQAILLSVFPYILLLMALSGWFSNQWQGVGPAMTKLDTVRFIPFYYHYYTSEMVALISLLAYAVMYAGLGTAYWLWHAFGTGSSGKGGVRVAAVLAAGTAFVIEAGKLFVSGKHPDPTNVLIGITAAVLAYRVAGWLASAGGDHRVTQTLLPEDAKSVEPVISIHREKDRSAGTEDVANEAVSTVSQPRGFYKVITLIFGLGVVAGIAAYPPGMLWLAIGFALYAFILFKAPSIWLLVVPAALPLLDFASWSGRFFLDEFDLLVMITLLVYFWKGLYPFSFGASGSRAKVFIYLLLATFIPSTLIGMGTTFTWDINAFSTYYSPYNSIRTVKGFLWAILLFPILRRSIASDHKSINLLLSGMLVGLGGFIVSALWERHVFTGLFDFSQAFRITGSFSSMHVGGPHIEAYLAAVLPLALGWIFYKRNTVAYLLGISLFVSGTYVMMVTYARGGYLGYIVAVMVFVIAFMASKNEGLLVRIKKMAGGLVVACMAMLVIIPVAGGQFLQSRLSLVDKDLGIRLSHWENTLQMRDPGIVTALFGMGMGSYPHTYLLRNNGNVQQSFHQYIQEEDNTYLSILGGNPVYVEQRISIKPHSRYKLSFDINSENPGSAISIAICEKAMLYSFACHTFHEKTQHAGNVWEHHELMFDSRGLGSIFGRTVKFSLYTTKPETVINIDNINMTDMHDTPVISNGDFSRGHDYWFFSADNNWAWHIENIWVQVLFEQGWFGLIIFTSFILFVLLRLVRSIRKGNLVSVMLLASLAGMISIGIFGSPLDSPRIGFLFLFILLLGAAVRDIARGQHSGTSGHQ